MFAELKIYAACFVTFVVVDFIWIGIVMKSFYVKQLGPIGRISGDKFEPVLWAAGVVYAALALGIVQFVLPKIGSETSWLSTFGTGALLGFVVYATYDFTNYSTLKDWTLAMTFTDVAWGTTVTGLVTVAARSVRDLG